MRSFADSPDDKYQLWAFDSGAPSGEREQGDAPAGDGVPNLLKYAMGLAPLAYCTTADLMMPVLDSQEQKFTVTYQSSKNAEGVTLYPLWTDALSEPLWQREGFEFRKLSETDASELWEAALPIAGRPSGFIRFRADLRE